MADGLRAPLPHIAFVTVVEEPHTGDDVHVYCEFVTSASLYCCCAAWCSTLWNDSKSCRLVWLCRFACEVLNVMCRERSALKACVGAYLHNQTAKTRKRMVVDSSPVDQSHLRSNSKGAPFQRPYLPDKVEPSILYVAEHEFTSRRQKCFRPTCKRGHDVYP